MSVETSSPPWFRRIHPLTWVQEAMGSTQRMIRAYRLILAGQRRAAYLLFGMILLAAAMNIAQVWLVREIVAALVEQDERRAMIAGIASAAGIGLVAMIKPWQDLLSTRIQDRATATIDTTLINMAGKWRDLYPFLRPDFQDVAQVTFDASLRLGVGVLQIGFNAPGALGAIGILLSLGALNPLIPVVLIAGALVQRAMVTRQWAIAWESMFHVARQGSAANHIKAIAILARAAAEVRMLNMGPWLRTRFNQLCGEMLAEMRPRRLRGGAWGIGGYAVQGTVIVGCFVYIASQARDGAIPVADLAFFISGLIAFQYQGEGIYRMFMELSDLNRVSKKLFELLDTAGPEIAVPPPGTGHIPAAEPTAGITLDSVAFTYPRSDQVILDNVSLDLPMGTVTALVGENGAGKSTLVNLLTRMLDPTAGIITLDGVPYPEHDLEALRERITVVYQDAARLAFPLEDNIAVADPGFSWTNPDAGRAKARTIAEQVGVGEIAASLPLGYQTELTRRYDDSVDLSGGQWQLVAFARGLVRDKAAIAILDEPSSALDPHRERDQILQLQAFARARRRAVLLISHRLSTVRWADQIAVLDGGRIVERGSHQELVVGNGTYAELFRMQASRYQEPSEN